MPTPVIAFMILLASAAYAVACEDPDAALSVGDKSKARTEYLKCLIEKQRVIDSAARSVTADQLQALEQRTLSLEMEVRSLRQQIEMMNRVPFPTK